MSDSRALVERIAALVPSFQGISGPGRQLTALAVALRGTGVDCLVVAFHRRGAPPSTFGRYLEEAGIRHCVVEDRGPADWRLALKVGAVLRRWRPSILQTHGYKATAVAYVLRRMGHSWPWIGCFHGATSANVKSRCYHWMDRRLLGAAERVVVMSQVEAQTFRHCRRRVRTIYNAALRRPLARDALERERFEALAGSLRRPIVGMVGRLSPEKGVDLFLDACAVLARKGIAFSALVAGDGPERGRLEARRRRLGLQSYVQFLGQVHDVDLVYQRLDLLVLPSRSEGLPNSLLEAMQAGLPVVATAVGGVPEVVGASRAARLVAPGSPAALVEAIEDAITHGDSAQAAAARREVVSQLSLGRRLAAHVHLYREVLEEWRGPVVRAESVRPACAGSPAP